VLESPIFQSVVNYFCDFLSLFRSPAVFILDTCEELARVHGEAGLRPAVEATFKIFEMVQARIKLMNDPQLKPPRIIFAGRRLLAVAGDRWEAAGDSGPARAGILGERRDYLRVEVLRGFTRREAHTFLTEPEYKGPPSDAKHSAMNPTLEEAVLSHSPESLSSDKIIAPTMVSPPSAATSQEQPRPEASVRVSRFHGGGEADTDAKRYNPFDLSLYADWYNDQPTLTDAELRRGGSDPYIRNRIIGRLKRGDVLAALPFLVELRRVGCAMAPDGTRPLLQRALQITDTEFDLLRRELCQLEWLDYQTENRGTIERIFLSVDRNLLSRFQRFLAGPEWRARREQARDVLRPLLHEHMEAPLLEDLETSYLTAALRLLPRTEAAWLWAAIESKVAAEAAWGWASNICRDIVAAAEAHTEYELLRREGGEEVVPLLTTDPDGDVVGHVRATLASASIHTSAKADLRLLWERVRLEAQEYEVPELGTWLWQRAVLGRLASQTQQNEVPTSAALDNLRELLASQTLDLRSWSPGTSPSDPTVMERALQIRASAIARRCYPSRN
jgi:hypothetical protein